MRAFAAMFLLTTMATARVNFWAPVDPSRAHYSIQARFVVESSRLEGTETIRFRNDARHDELKFQAKSPLEEVVLEPNAVVAMIDSPLDRRRTFSASDTDWAFAALVWQGHLLDLMGRRAEAVTQYQEALKVPGAPKMQHSQYNLTIDKPWVEERLKTPFERK